MSSPDHATGNPVGLRAIAVLGIVALLAACTSSKTTQTRKVQQARAAAQAQAAKEAARPRPFTGQYIQDATIRFGQVWQRFLDQYGDRLTVGSSVVAVVVVTDDGRVAGLRFEQPTADADMLERGIEVALSATQFDPFPDEMLRELSPIKSVELRFPIAVR